VGVKGLTVFPTLNGLTAFPRGLPFVVVTFNFPPLVPLAGLILPGELLTLPISPRSRHS
jgi:hypothetical protein